MIRLLNYLYIAATPVTPIEPTYLPNPGQSTSITSVLQFIFGLAASLALIMLAIGGLRYTISRGDPGSIKTAKETIIYALIGFLITVGAFGIVTFVFGKVRP